MICPLSWNVRSSRLVEWKGDHDGGLILRGPCQVGKTFVLEQFMNEYESALLINLEEEPRLRAVF